MARGSGGNEVFVEVYRDLDSFGETLSWSAGFGEGQKKSQPSHLSENKDCMECVLFHKPSPRPKVGDGSN